MLLNFIELQRKYNMKINGVLHIGAHICDEYHLYKHLNISRIIMFEPVSSTFEILKIRYELDPSVILINKALGNFNGYNIIHISSNKGVSSSLLIPKKHITQYPHITFDDKEEVMVVKLDDFWKHVPLLNASMFNFINIDVQGYELEVFKGATKTLKYIDYIISEVNRDELYEDCAQIQELDEFLRQYNFVRKETTWDGTTWGDCLYIKENK